MDTSWVRHIRQAHTYGYTENIFSFECLAFMMNKCHTNKMKSLIWKLKETNKITYTVQPLQSPPSSLIMGNVKTLDTVVIYQEHS